MTDRYCVITVALEEDMREDDAEQLIEAIKQMRGVADAAGYKPSPDIYAAKARLRLELLGKIANLVNADLQ